VIKALVLPGAGTLGDYLAFRIRFLHWKRGVRAVEEARELLTNAGLPVQPVEIKLLIPIIERAAMEDEDTLVSRWARLLASASAGAFVPPSFPGILAELTPTDVLILDHIASRWPALVSTGQLDDGERVSETDRPNLATLAKELALPLDVSRVSIDGLLRLRLIVLSSLNLDDMSDQPLRRDYQIPGLTDLGIAFVRACAGPRRAE
jgi:hypothetical protein